MDVGRALGTLAAAAGLLRLLRPSGARGSVAGLDQSEVALANDIARTMGDPPPVPTSQTWHDYWAAERDLWQRHRDAIRASWPRQRVIALSRAIEEVHGLPAGILAGVMWSESKATPVGPITGGTGTDTGVGQILASRWYQSEQPWCIKQPYPWLHDLGRIPHPYLMLPTIGVASVGASVLRAASKGRSLTPDGLAPWWTGGASQEAKARKARSIRDGQQRAATVAPMPHGLTRILAAEGSLTRA